MRIGALDRRIIIQGKTSVPDDHGEMIETWSDLATVWARRLPLRESESFAARQTGAVIECKYRIRFRRNISPLNRLMDTSDGNRVYDIHGVSPIGRNEGLDLLASARGE